MFSTTRTKTAGFTLIEVVIVASLAVAIFGAFFGSFKYTIELINNSRAKLSALSVANDRMEFFRSLPYDDVGTLLGIPSGVIPQNSTTTLNGIEFAERVLVEYVDDPADGVGVLDTNGILADYKRLKLEYVWKLNGTDATSSIALISNIVPVSIETTAGGGTVKINVIDDSSALLAGASVRLLNDTTAPAIDVTRTTDANGVAYFSGAPAGSDYEVFVTANISGNDYSAAQTHEATTTNPNPSVSPFAVLESDVSTLTFQIGELSDLDIALFSSRTEGSFIETFTDLLSVASSTSVDISTGALVLADTLGVYDLAGAAYLGPIQPSPLLSWETIRLAGADAIDTAYKVQLFTGAGSGPYTLVPDVDLPGNSGGFSTNLIDISVLDNTAYPTLFAGVSLSTTDTAETPAVDEVSVFYRQADTVLANTNFDIRGDKIIGTDAVAAPIYKYSISTTTDGAGQLDLSDLEFDNYSLTVAGGDDIASACSAHPFVHKAGVDGELSMILAANAAETARVTVTDTFGTVIPGVTVNITRAGYDVTIQTGICGQAFFTGGMTANSDYVLDVSAAGYVSQNITNFDVNGDVVKAVTLSEL